MCQPLEECVAVGRLAEDLGRDPCRLSRAERACLGGELPEAREALSLDVRGEATISLLLGVDLVRKLHLCFEHHLAHDRAVLDVGNEHLGIP